MAIGDAIVQYVLASPRTVQPASGVEAQITCVVKFALSTGNLSIYDGTTLMNFLDQSTRTSESDPADANAGRRNYHNLAVMITNAMYLYQASSGPSWISGVTTNV
jgi:hypothetical protein